MTLLHDANSSALSVLDIPEHLCEGQFTGFDSSKVNPYTSNSVRGIWFSHV